MSHLTYPGCPLFHYTGVVIWAFLTLVGIVCLCSLTVRLWKRHVSVRFHNLFYIVFGFLRDGVFHHTRSETVCPDGVTAISLEEGERDTLGDLPAV